MSEIKTTKGMYNETWRCVTVRSKDINEYISYINEHSIQSIYIVNGAYKMDNIDFLKECPSIIEVNLNSELLKNIDGLYALNGLKSLVVNEIDAIIDLAKLNTIESLSADYRLVDNFDSLPKVKEILFTNLPGKEPFTNFKKNNSVQIADFYPCKAVTLKGIEAFSNLERLSIFDFTKLENIEDIEYLSESLTLLSIEGCKKIGDYMPIKKLTNLKELMLFNDGEIENISFIENLHELESFNFRRTTIIDGDVSYCKRLKHCEFDNKKFYSNKCEDFEKDYQ